MPKRPAKSDDSASKRSRDEALTCIVCGLYAEGKLAAVESLLKELKSATVLVSDLSEAQQAVPKKGAFEVTEYKTETPQLPAHGPTQNVLVLAHDLAKPSRVAASMAAAGRGPAVRLLTVLDARVFLEEWESSAELPLALREAAKKDVRAHLHAQKACEVLAEHVESADVIALSHADSADADELEMLEAMLNELNPSATVVRLQGEAAGKLLEHVAHASSERPPPAERSGCWQLLKRGRLDGVIRSSGVCWMATHPKETIAWKQVGNSMNLLPGEPWLKAKLPVAEWPADAPRWARTAAHGDRRIELGLIGMDADVDEVRRVLSRALVTKAEFERGLWGCHERHYWWLLGARAMASREQ